MRNTQSKFRLDRLSFAAGFVAAGIVILLLLAGLGGMAATQGVTVRLEGEELAALIRERIASQVRAEMPKIIEEAKAGIPAIVEKEMETQFTSNRMEIAGFVFKMPEELMTQLKNNMRDNVEQATGQILDGIDTNQLAEKFGANAYQLVQESIQSELDGQSFHVLVFNRIPLRISVRVE